MMKNMALPSCVSRHRKARRAVERGEKKRKDERREHNRRNEKKLVERRREQLQTR